MKLADGERHTHAVNVGLVDSRGMFVLLLDDNETAYYRFSDESNLIAQLRRDADYYEKRALKLEGELHDAELKIGEWRARSDKYRHELDKLRKRKVRRCPECGAMVRLDA